MVPFYMNVVCFSENNRLTLAIEYSITITIQRITNSTLCHSSKLDKIFYSYSVENLRKERTALAITG